MGRAPKLIHLVWVFADVPLGLTRLALRGRHHRPNLSDVGSCYCGNAEVEDVHHALWEYSLYEEKRTELLDRIKVLEVGPVDFRQLRDSAWKWHHRRCRLERT